jgi:hypothetical protein
MKLIGNEKMPPSWARRLEELIVCAVTGDRRTVVEKLDGLVKGYRPYYELHGVADPKTAEQGRSCELPQNRDRREPLDPGLPPDPASPSKSVH